MTDEEGSKTTDADGPGPLAPWVSCPHCDVQHEDVHIVTMDGEHIEIVCEFCKSRVVAYHGESQKLEQLI